MGMESTYALSAWFFARALSLVYVAAFLSLAVQAKGLWGAQGVLPIHGFLEAVSAQVDTSRYWQLPTVFWWWKSEAAITGAAWVGVAAAIAALFGFAQGWMFLLCFALYVSYVSAGQVFMWFQWDALLCEAGFLALFAVPWALRLDLTHAYEPHAVVRWAFYALLFKLMFLSGAVKLLSGDESWRDLTAMTYHYWTQPLPNPLAPFLHALPKWFHQGETAGTFAVELAAPFLIFWPRARPVAALAFVGLSVLILLTGNYTFFNWLTIALAIWLLPDAWWNRLAEKMPFGLEAVPAPLYAGPPLLIVMGALIVISALFSIRWLFPDALARWTEPVLRWAQVTHVSSSYGLFANMTKSRPEIVIEGSADGREWREYGFRYKPGREYRMPPVVAPHQPRLDWQMWFAALGSLRENPWLQNLLARLHEGSPDVLALLDENPFPDKPPAYLRLRLYEYKFGTPAEIWEEGRWWKRTSQGDYR